MQQRAVIAAAVINHPRLLIADEPTTALDTVTKAGILALLQQLCRVAGTAVLLITHDLNEAGVLADRIAVLYAGRLVEVGATAEILHRPAHPYTRALLAAHPSRAATPRAPLPLLGPPSVAEEFVARCAFGECCAWRIAECDRAVPEFVRLATTGPAQHNARCLRAGDVQVSP
jgi:oligopeptide/dipeptide ABC transporter ATP-binding protein